jgi:phosphopantothenoylcysteine decarboxylase/phosphopantothenate--cysteine ligase
MNVLLGVTGGIAAYKAPEIARQFVKRNDDVRAVMTDGASEFVQPMTLQVLTEHPVGTEVFDATWEDEIGHIELARWADAVLIAPATADAMARMAQGMADDLLTTIVLATEAPVVVAPSMNTQMWRHPATRRNAETLADELGYRVVDPDAGELACKEVGAGRMPDPSDLVEEVAAAAAPDRLEGRSVLVTGGPTREHVDPARLLTNPSTGRMGYAAARVARRFGAETTLVTGPTDLTPPAGVETVAIESAREMYDAVIGRAADVDMICKAAAVCDWRPREARTDKLSKSDMEARIDLVRNPDILAELGDRYGPRSGERADEGPVLVGFAAETEELVARGQDKLESKDVHMIVANHIGGDDSAFGADSVQAHLLTRENVTSYGPISKEDLAAEVWKRALELDEARR